MRVDETVRKCVFFIGRKTTDESFIPLGTGFILTSDFLERRFAHFVTARHVIDLCGETVWLRFNKIGGGSKVLPSPKQEWKFHPNATPFVDVAVLPAGLGPDEDLDLTAHHDSAVVDAALIDNLKISAGEPIMAIGLFISHMGVLKNVPIVRIGNIAAMRNKDDPVWTSRGFMDAYLVEARSIGGLSGSPVFVQVSPHRIVEGKVHSSIGLQSHYLLGLMQGHFALKEPTDIVAIENEDETADLMNAGIGLVVPVDKILETINRSDLVATRESIVKKLF